jgi:hypothetical protein
MLANLISLENMIKCQEIGKEELKLSLFIDGMIIYVEKFERINQKSS